MPDTKVSDFTAAGALDGTEVVPILKSGNKRTTTGEIAALTPSYTDEQVRDVIAAALVEGSGVTITPDDGSDTITISASGGGGVTLSQGTLGGRGSASGTGSLQAITVGPGLSMDATTLRGGAKVLTPYHFGAVGDLVTNDTTALQAFFDHAKTPANAKANIYNFAGDWLINATVYASFPNDDVTRRFVAGNLHVASGASLAVVLERAGYSQEWHGILRINGAGQTVNQSYTNRRFYTGVRDRFTNGSNFAHATIVDNARRHAVLSDSSYGAFSMNSVSYPHSNNIGARYGPIQGRIVGSNSQASGYTVAFTGNTLSGSGNSAAQRSSLTVTTSAEFLVNDFIKVARVLSSTQFGTVSFDATTRKATRTSGSWVTDGVEVGAKYVIGGAGANNVTGEIVAVTATDITFAHTPVTAAASASPTFTLWSFHQIKAIPDGTHISVFPWVSDLMTSGTVYGCQGAVFASYGGDQAQVSVEKILGLYVGVGAILAGQYGTGIGEFTANPAEIGAVFGVDNASVSFGNMIKGPTHCEGTVIDVLEVANAYGYHHVAGNSNLLLAKCMTLAPKATTAQVKPTDAVLYNTTIDLGGVVYGSRDQYPHEGDGGNDWPLTNNPRRTPRRIQANSFSITVEYDEDVGRNFAGHAFAELYWTGPSVNAPTGTGAFALTTLMTNRGWTIAGATSTTAPGNAVKFEVSFNSTTKVVKVAKFVAS